MNAGAFFLSLLFPGAGQVLQGRLVRGALWFALAGALGVALPFFGAAIFVKALGHLAAAFDAGFASPRPQSNERLVVGIVSSIVGNIAVLLVLRFTWVEPFKIPAGSMLPTIQVGDHLLVWRSSGAPSRGDVIVFKYPVDRSKDFIKRVIGVAGDEVHIVGETVYVNGAPIPHREILEPYEYSDYNESSNEWSNLQGVRAEEDLGSHHYSVIERTPLGQSWPEGDLDQRRRNCGMQGFCVPPDAVAADWDAGKYVVPAGKVFVLGDNRDNSHDSRFWGSVPVADVKGKATSIWWSSGGDPKHVRWSRLGSAIH